MERNFTLLNWQKAVEEYLIQNNGFRFVSSTPDYRLVIVEYKGLTILLSRSGVVECCDKLSGISNIEIFKVAQDLRSNCPAILPTHNEYTIKIRYSGNLKELDRYHIPYIITKDEENIIKTSRLAYIAIWKDIHFNSFPDDFNISLTILPNEK